LPDSAARVLDGKIVLSISPSLEEATEAGYERNKLVSNRSIAFVGHDIKGSGFILSPAERARLLEVDPNNSDVIYPYVKGNELNQSPEVSPQAFIINFRDWPINRSQQYSGCYARVLAEVKPQRELKNRKAHRVNWWRYADYRRGLELAVGDLDIVIAMTIHNKHLVPTFAPGHTIYSHGCVIFASDNPGLLALLSGAVHYTWSTTGGASSLSTTSRYAPSDKFETFPLPELTEEMRQLGNRLNTFRQDMMLSRDSGITKTYNMVFDPTCSDEDVDGLRRIHKTIDDATVRAYGWDDLLDQLDHGFHKVGHEIRYTICSAAQRTILDRLLKLNHERYAEEMSRGLHNKKRGLRMTATQSSEGALFDVE
jgi:hypothetical protein